MILPLVGRSMNNRVYISLSYLVLVRFVLLDL